MEVDEQIFEPSSDDRYKEAYSVTFEMAFDGDDLPVTCRILYGLDTEINSFVVIIDFDGELFTLHDLLPQEAEEYAEDVFDIVKSLYMSGSSIDDIVAQVEEIGFE